MKLFLTLAAALLVVAATQQARASTAFSCAYFDSPSTTGITVTGFNNQRQVVGWTYDSQYHAFLRNPDGSIKPLTSPAGTDDFIPVGINNFGQVAGPSFIINPDGSTIDIAPAEAPAGHTYQSQLIRGINDKGDLVGTILEDYSPEQALNLVFVRTRDGVYSILDKGNFDDPSYTLIPVAINNAGYVVELLRGQNGYLLRPDGSKTPLNYPGLPFDFFDNSIGGSIQIMGMNGFGDIAGRTINYDAPGISYIHNRAGGFQSVICPDGKTFTIGGINDRNEVAGYDVLGKGVIATHTGAFPHISASAENWTFDPLPVGQTSSAVRFFVTDLGDADLNIAAVYIGLPGLLTDQENAFHITNSDCASVPDGPDEISPLSPSQSCFVDVVFNPQVMGNQTAALYVPTDAHNSPFIIQLLGTGTK